VSWPTLLLALQLGVGLYAAFELARGLLRGRPGRHLLGPALLAVLLIPLALDGLFAYQLDLEPSWIRPAQLGLIALGTVLWMQEPPSVRG
jgi:hypothetical protein